METTGLIKLTAVLRPWMSVCSLILLLSIATMVTTETTVLPSECHGDCFKPGIESVTTESSSLPEAGVVTKKPRVHLMGFGAITVAGNGWSSAGTIPAIEMAVEDINNDDNILSDYELVVDMKNSGCDPGLAVQALYDHLLTPPVKVMILGGGCSIATAPVARTAPYFGLVQLGYSVGSPELSQRSYYPTFFRTSMSDLANVWPITRLCLRYDWNNVVTLHEQDPLFTMTANRLHFIFSMNNITLITAESYKVDPTEPLRNILRKRGKIIIFFGYEDTARRVFCQAFRLGMYGPRYQWLIPGWFNDNWLDINDTECDVTQVKAAADYALTLTDLKGDLSGKKTISGQTYAQYEARYLSWPTLPRYGINAYHPNGYDGVWALALALNASAPIIAESSVTEVGPNGTLVSRPKRLDDFRYGAEPQMSALFFEALTNVNFPGVSGTVAFDLGERKAINDIKQIIGNTWERVATYDEVTDSLTFYRDIKWQGPGPPQDILVPRDITMYNNPILIVCACSLSVLGAMLGLGFLLFNIRNSMHHHIKMSSPRLNNIVTLGCVLTYVAVVLFGMDTQLIPAHRVMSTICSARSWALALGFTLAFGAMFAKTWRVHVIFTQKVAIGHKPVHDKHLMGFVAVLALIDVIVLTTWTVINPFEVRFRNISTIEEVDFVTTRRIEYCHSDNLWYWMGAMYLVKGLLLVFGCFLAYETRKVHIPGLNDSTNIGICVYNVVVMCLVGVTVSLVLNDKVDITYAFQAVSIFFCTFTTLFVLFLPKVRYVLKHPTENGKKAPDGMSHTFKYTMENVKSKTGGEGSGGEAEGVSEAAGKLQKRQATLHKKEKEVADKEAALQLQTKTCSHMEAALRQIQMFIANDGPSGAAAILEKIVSVIDSISDILDLSQTQNFDGKLEKY